jgi:hypothetical protein
VKNTVADERRTRLWLGFGRAKVPGNRMAGTFGATWGWKGVVATAGVTRRCRYVELHRVLTNARCRSPGEQSLRACKVDPLSHTGYGTPVWTITG